MNSVAGLITSPSQWIIFCLTTSMFYFNYTQLWLPSASSNLLDYGLSVHLQFHSVGTVKWIFEFTWYRYPSGPPYLLSHGLKIDMIRTFKGISRSSSTDNHSLHVPMIMASNQIFNVPYWWPPRASLSSVNLILQVYLQTGSITTSKCIIKLTWSPCSVPTVIAQTLPPTSPDILHSIG